MLLAHAHYKLDDFLLTTNTVSYVALPHVREGLGKENIRVQDLLGILER